jgi:hypothetical protein
LNCILSGKPDFSDSWQVQLVLEGICLFYSGFLFLLKYHVMKTKNLLIVLCFLFSAFLANAQDTIYKRNKEVINAKITEIGLDEIKYKLSGYEEGPTVVVAKDQVWKIVFANGLTQTLQPEMFNPENYASQKKNAIKIDFLAPMLQHVTFVYEHSLKPGQSVEASIGIIGIGFNTESTRHPQGGFVRFGYKFMKSPDYYVRGMKYAHILKGSYVRPDILLGSYTQDYSFYSYGYYNSPYFYEESKKIRINYGALQITFGKQWIFDDAFLVDYFVGLGYVVTSQNGNNSGNLVKYGVTQTSNESPLALSGGLRIGFLFK